MDLYLSLGSNLGAREDNIDRAICLLDEVFSSRRGQSEIVQTQACGFDGPPFLNMVARYESALPPLEVLAACKEIERRMGRTDAQEFDKKGRRIYHDRIIDIDILKYGDVVMDTPELTIPHPQVKERPFISPLMEEAAR